MLKRPTAAWIYKTENNDGSLFPSSQTTEEKQDSVHFKHLLQLKVLVWELEDLEKYLC